MPTENSRDSHSHTRTHTFIWQSDNYLSQETNESTWILKKKTTNTDFYELKLMISHTYCQYLYYSTDFGGNVPRQCDCVNTSFHFNWDSANCHKNDLSTHAKLSVFTYCVTEFNIEFYCLNFQDFYDFMPISSLKIYKFTTCKRQHRTRGEGCMIRNTVLTIWHYKNFIWV